MKVLFKHRMIKNENDYDVDALMTFTIITRPFFYFDIHKWKNQRGRIDSLLLWVSRLSARQTELYSMKNIPPYIQIRWVANYFTN